MNSNSSDEDADHRRAGDPRLQPTVSVRELLEEEEIEKELADLFDTLCDLSQMSLENLMDELNTDFSQGLSRVVVEKKKSRYGNNALRVPRRKGVIRGFSQLIPTNAAVIRDGKEDFLNSRDLVPGDVIGLKSGDRVPADCRILSASPNLEVDCMLYTGDAAPRRKSENCDGDDILDTDNIVFFACAITAGTCTAVVLSTGKNLVLAKIAEETETLEKRKLKTNIPKSLKRNQLRSKYGLLTQKNTIAGLLSITTTVITDMVNIITTGDLEPERVWISGSSCVDWDECDGSEYHPLWQCILHNPTGKTSTAMETMLDSGVNSCLPEDFDEDEPGKPASRVPFNKIGQFKAGVYAAPAKLASLKKKSKRSFWTVYLRGDPHDLWERCSSVLIDGKTVAKTKKHTKKFTKVYKDMDEEGETAVGFAMLHLDSSYNASYRFKSRPPNFPLEGLSFVGMVSLCDHVRPGVADGIEELCNVGVETIMVTGARPCLAERIGREAGLLTHPAAVGMELDRIKSDVKSIIILGTQLADYGADELERIFTDFDEVVFASTAPHQKLKLVEWLQDEGNEIVACVGGTVNCSPSLKKADVGVAPLPSANDVAKEAANAIMTENSFADFAEVLLACRNAKKSGLAGKCVLS